MAYTETQIEQIISDVATSLGVDPNLAIATAKVESGLNPTSVGDGGTSFGLFQLHRGGELGSLTPQQAFDPRKNATVALSQFAKVQKTHPGLDPGKLAALSQRPADPSGYAAKVDKAMGGVTAPSGGSTSDGGATPVTTVGVSNPLSGINDTLTTLSDKAFWVRVAFILGGFVVIMIGVRALLNDGVFKPSQDAAPMQQNTSTSSVMGGSRAKAGGASTSEEAAVAA